MTFMIVFYFFLLNEIIRWNVEMKVWWTSGDSLHSGENVAGISYWVVAQLGCQKIQFSQVSEVFQKRIKDKIARLLSHMFNHLILAVNVCELCRLTWIDSLNTIKRSLENVWKVLRKLRRIWKESLGKSLEHLWKMLEN